MNNGKDFLIYYLYGHLLLYSHIMSNKSTKKHWIHALKSIDDYFDPDAFEDSDFVKTLGLSKYQCG